MKLRKDTLFERAMLSQEWREIIAPEQGSEGLRRVVLSIPFATPIYISLKEDADKLYGANRTYKGPVARPGADIEFHLRPNQGVWGATQQGAQDIAVLIEFLGE